MVGAVAVFVGVSTFYALSDPPFRPRDEQAHLAYAHAIARGQLPEIDSPGRVPASATGWQTRYDANPDDRYRQVWVANHPPLHYMLSVPAVWIANAMDRPDGGLMFLRLMNITLAATGLVFTYLFAYELSGRSRRLGLVATTMVALLPNPQVFYAGALNDGLGFATITALLWVVARHLKRCSSGGVGSLRGLAPVSAAVALACASRATGLLVSLAVVAVLLAFRFAWDSSPLALRLRRAVSAGVVVLGPAALLSGWFYIRNIVLYGDIGASSFLMDRFNRQPREPFSEFMFDHQWWSWLYTSIATRPFGLDIADVGRRVEFVVALAAGGLLLALVAPWLGKRRRGPTSTERANDTADIPRDGRADRVNVFIPAVVVGLVATAVLMVAMAQHVSSGGLPHLRYLYPSLGALAAMVAVGLDRLLPKLLPLAVVVAQSVLLVGLLSPTAEELRAQVTPMPSGLDFVPSSTMTRGLALALAGVGACMLAAVLTWTLIEPLARRRGMALGSGGGGDGVTPHPGDEHDKAPGLVG